MFPSEPFSGTSSVSLQSVLIHWEHPETNWSLQSVCLPLKVDFLRGGARLCIFDIRQGYFRDHTLAHFNPALLLEKFFCGGNRVIPVSAVSCCPLAEHLFHPLPPLGVSLNRTVQTKWPSKWAVACQLWNKSSRSSPLPPHPLQFLGFLSSECHTKSSSLNLYFIRTYQVSFPREHSWKRWPLRVGCA